MIPLSVVEYNEAVSMADQISHIWRSEEPKRERVDHPERPRFSTYFNPLSDASTIRGQAGTNWINLYFPVPCRFEGDEATAVVVGVLLHEWLHVIQEADSPKEFAHSKKRQAELEFEFENVAEIPLDRLWQDYYSDPLEVQAHAIQIAAESRYRGAKCFSNRDAEAMLGYRQPFSRLKDSNQYTELWREIVLPAAETAFACLFY